MLAQRYLDLGCTFVAVGVDVLMFANAARKAARAICWGTCCGSSKPKAAY